MSIADNNKEYEAALSKAHKDFPIGSEKFRNKPNNCTHRFIKTVYCDGGDWDIVRCMHCGKEIVTRCTFDDDYS